jgi:hypothetical protein
MMLPSVRTIASKLSWDAFVAVVLLFLAARHQFFRSARKKQMSPWVGRFR